MALGQADPMADIRGLLADLPAIDRAARLKTAQLIAAHGEGAEFGRLRQLALWLADWRGAPPNITRPHLAIFAGRQEGIDAIGFRTPSALVDRQIDDLQSGTHPAARLCARHGFGLAVFDLARASPLPDPRLAEAMDPRAFAATIAFGMEALAPQPDLLLLTQIADGEEIAHAALALRLYGGEARFWLGAERAPKPTEAAIDAVEAIAARHAATNDPLELLRRVGGRDLAALCGAIIAARKLRAPCIIEGIGAVLAAGVLKAIVPDSLDHCLFARGDSQDYVDAIFDRIGVRPVIDFGLVRTRGCAAGFLALAAQSVCAMFGD